ncbi:hypothetical protein, partial [Vibrio cholerae]
CAWFDEFNKPSSAIISDVKAYQETHNKFVEKRIKNLTTETKPLRKSVIIPMQPIQELLPSQFIAKQVRQSIIALHDQHSVKVECKNVSIGL